MVLFDSFKKGSVNANGIKLANLGKYQEALECFDKAIKLSPNRSETWYNKGSALLKLGRYQEALECYDKSLKLNSKDPMNWFKKGMTLGNLKKNKKKL